MYDARYVRCLLGRSSRLWRLEGRLWAFDFVQVLRQTGQQEFDELHRILLVSSPKLRRIVFHLRHLRCGSTVANNSNQSPGIIHDPSILNIQNPSITIHHPLSIIHYPSSINHHPTSINHHPLSVIQHPSITIHPPSSTIHQSSSIILQSPSVIHHPRSLSHHPTYPSIIIHHPTIKEQSRIFGANQISETTMAVYWIMSYRILLGNVIKGSLGI